MAESLLVLGINPPARLRCCECCAAGDGARALRAHCLLFIRFDPRPWMDDGEAGLLPAGAACLRALWMLHRNEPGWFVFVEEHVQDCRLLVEDGDKPLTDLPGEWVASSPASLARVGEAERQLGVREHWPVGPTRIRRGHEMRDRGA